MLRFGVNIHELCEGLGEFFVARPLYTGQQDVAFIQFLCKEINRHKQSVCRGGFGVRTEQFHREQRLQDLAKRIVLFRCEGCFKTECSAFEYRW